MNFKIFGWRSLKTRVTLLTLAIFLISVWSLTFYNSMILREDMQHLLGDQQFSMASFIAEGVTEELEKRKNSMENIAKLISPALQQGNVATVQMLLEQRPVHQSHFNGGTFVTGIDGIAIADVPLSTGRIGMNSSDRGWMIEALKGKFAVGKPIIGKKLQVPVFSLAQPVSDTEGKVIGVVVGVTDLSKPNFLDKIADNHYGKTGGYLLVAPQHKLVITGTDKSRTMQPVPAAGINPLFDRYMQGFEGSGVVVDSRGLEVLSAAKHIPVADWILVVRIPTAEAFAPIHTMQQRMLLISFFLTLLASGLTWWMLRRQLAPMLAAAKILATQSISDLPSQPLPVTRPDEVGELIGSFNHLLKVLSQREEVLTETKELFALFLKHSPIYTYIKEMTPTGVRVLHASENFQEMIGIPGAKMSGKMMAELFPAEFAAKITADDQAVAAKGEVLKIDEDLNGRFYTTIKFPLLLRDKILLAGYTIDITERKQVKDALQKSEEKYRTILANIEDGYYEVALDGNLTFFNDSFCRIWGYPKDELMGMNYRQYTDSENAKIIFQAFNGIYKKGNTTKEHDWQIIRKDGTTRFIEASISLIKDSSDIPTGFRGIIRDVTERTLADTERAKLEGQLQQAQKMESVGRLAGGVAHDFNNMLGVIIGYSELILDQVDPSHPFRADLEEIEKAARRSADLTRQLLTFARKQTVAPQVLDLNQTIEGMLNMLRRLIGENISLVWMPESGLWPIKMDPSQIDQILANLCVNARDAITGVGKMTVATKNTSLDEEYCTDHPGSVPGEYVQIAVSDTGHGMDKETQDHIFEPFFTTKGVGEGTGLGLATVYGAVKQNNGFINAYSEPEIGTTFTIYIPRHVAKAQQAPKTASAEPLLHGHEVILLVEDEPTILNMTKAMLKRLGYTVLAAGTPGEAFRLVDEFPGQIHLLVTDVIMPEMNGRELGEKLLESRPGMKHLFISGYPAEIIARQGILEEGVCFIQKPFSKNGLAAKVREALANI